MIFIGAHDWAKTTLTLHEKDKRQYVYTREQLEKGQSHDELWNAAQVKRLTEILILHPIWPSPILIIYDKLRLKQGIKIHGFV